MDIQKGAWLNYGQLPVDTIAKLWFDPELREKLIADPKATLQALGYKIEDDVEIVLHTNSRNTLHLTLPEIPAEAEGQSLEELIELSTLSTKCGATGTCDSF